MGALYPVVSTLKITESLFVGEFIPFDLQGLSEKVWATTTTEFLKANMSHVPPLSVSTVGTSPSSRRN